MYLFLNVSLLLVDIHHLTELCVSDTSARKIKHFVFLLHCKYVQLILGHSQSYISQVLKTLTLYCGSMDLAVHTGFLKVKNCNVGGTVNSL